MAMYGMKPVLTVRKSRRAVLNPFQCSKCDDDTCVWQLKLLPEDANEADPRAKPLTAVTATEPCHLGALC